MKKIFLIFNLLLLAYSSQALADIQPNNPNSEIYTFHLWYANGGLQKDSDFSFPFNQTFGEYRATPTATDAYRGKIISIKGTTLATIYFSPATMLSGNSGKLSLEAPYFPNAKTAVFYDAPGKELLTIDLAPNGPLCNENGTCDDAFGENNQNCPADCQEMSVELKNTQGINDNPEEVTGNNKKSMLTLFISIAIAGLLIITITAWIIIKKRKLKSF